MPLEDRIPKLPQQILTLIINFTTDLFKDKIYFGQYVITRINKRDGSTAFMKGDAFSDENMIHDNPTPHMKAATDNLPLHCLCISAALDMLSNLVVLWKRELRYEKNYYTVVKTDNVLLSNTK